MEGDDKQKRPGPRPGRLELPSYLFLPFFLPPFFRAGFRAAFFLAGFFLAAAFRAGFLEAFFLAAFLPGFFFAGFFLAAFFRAGFLAAGALVAAALGAGGAGGGLIGIGSGGIGAGSIHPEPDQPISIMLSSAIGIPPGKSGGSPAASVNSATRSALRNTDTKMQEFDGCARDFAHALFANRWRAGPGCSVLYAAAMMC
ncbi:MAG: hypothetical protein ACHQ2E_05825 [Gemmatimonadales bacterium]